MLKKSPRSFSFLALIPKHRPLLLLTLVLIAFNVSTNAQVATTQSKGKAKASLTAQNNADILAISSQASGALSNLNKTAGHDPSAQCNPTAATNENLEPALPTLTGVKIAGFQKIGKEPYQLSLATPSGRLGTGLIEIGKSFDLPGSPTATYQIVSYNAKEGFAIIKNLSTPPYQLYKVRDYFVSSGDARTSPATTGPSAALTDKLTPPTVSGPEGSIREIPPDIAALSGDDLEYELTILGVKAEEAREQKQHAFFAKDAGDFYGENMVTSYDRGLKLQYDNNRMRIVNAHTETISPVYTKAQLNEMAKSRDPEFLQKIYARYSSGYGPDRVNVSDFIENSRFTKLPGGSGHLLIDPKGEYHLIPLGRGNSMTIFNSHQFPMDVPQNSNPPPETPGP